MKLPFAKFLTILLLGFSSLNLLANDITTLDELKINNENKFKNINKMTEVLEENFNQKINSKYNCKDLFKKFKTSDEYKRRSSEGLFSDVFVLYYDYYDNNNKPSFLGISSINVTKVTNNKCEITLKDSDYSSNSEKEKMKFYPNIDITTELFSIYFDDLIKNFDIKNDTRYDYVAMYNIYKNFQNDVEIKNFMKNHLNDGKYTYDKKLVLRALVDENYKIILEKQKKDILEENKKITSNQEVLKKLEKSIDDNNKLKIIDSFEVYPFVY